MARYGYKARAAGTLVKAMGLYKGSRIAKASYNYATGRGFKVGYDRTGGFYGRFSGKGKSELKYFDTALENFTITATGVNIKPNLNKVPIGNGESDRVGRRITVKEINVNMSVDLAATATITAGSQMVRILLVLDKQCNGTPATWLQVFTDDDFHTSRNLSETNRFTVIKEKRLIMNRPNGNTAGSATGGYGEYARHVSFTARVNHRIEYGDTSTDGSIGTIRSNNFFMLVIMENADTGTITEGRVRIRYSDA